MTFGAFELWNELFSCLVSTSVLLLVLVFKALKLWVQLLCSLSLLVSWSLMVLVLSLEEALPPHPISEQLRPNGGSLTV